MDVDLESLIPGEGDLSDEDVRWRVAQSLVSEGDWEYQHIDVLVEILASSTHGQRRKALVQQMRNGISPEALRLAHELRSAWNEWVEGDERASLSWAAAVSFAEAFQGYPDLDELMCSLTEVYGGYETTRAKPGPLPYRRYFSTYLQELLNEPPSNHVSLGDELVMRTHDPGLRA